MNKSEKQADKWEKMSEPKQKKMSKEEKITIEDVCKYASNCSEKDLYFIQKSIEFNKENIKAKMFEGSTKL
tara:strand:- start:1260 stop:1472 length:213 start_codon:yes stop_codon:yes gene_type:complete